MFDHLSKKLSSIFDHLKGRQVITEDHLKEALREIRIALLEADVSLLVVKEVMERIKEKALGQEVIKSVSPADQIIKIVHDELVHMLGEKNESLELTGKRPVSILMVGLQGSGKTTTTAKLAKYIHDKQHKKVLMTSLDIYRPAAREQLQQLGKQIGVDTLSIMEKEDPIDITKRALELGRSEEYDVIFFDTAGRLHIDQALIKEVQDIRTLVKPVETLLVTDAMIGQDATTMAKEFHEKVNLTGIVMTRMDGDARGGAALSMRAVTNCPIKFLGLGEKVDALEAFHPDRLADRILDMGDIVSLVEKAEENIDKQEAEALAQRMMEGQFNFEDMLKQFQQMKKMGNMKGLLKLIPGVSKFQDQIQKAGIDDGLIKKQEAMILSMTPFERQHPETIMASRKKRIASGAGVTINEINKLIKQYEKTADMMKKMKKMGGMQAMMEKMKEMENMPPGSLPPGM